MSRLSERTVVVPVDPTEEMLSAGDSMMPQIAKGEDITTGYDALREAWPAMLEARPGKAEPDARLTLPIPPSTNNLFRSGPRYKTEEYKRWITEASYGLMIQGMNGKLEGAPQGRYRVEIEAPFSRRRDLDNIKAVLDLIVKCGVITNDNRVDELLVRRVPVTEDLVVSIWRL